MKSRGDVLVSLQHLNKSGTLFVIWIISSSLWFIVNDDVGGRLQRIFKNSSFEIKDNKNEIGKNFTSPPNCQVWIFWIEYLVSFFSVSRSNAPLSKAWKIPLQSFFLKFCFPNLFLEFPFHASFYKHSFLTPFFSPCTAVFEYLDFSLCPSVRKKLCYAKPEF